MKYTFTFGFILLSFCTSFAQTKSVCDHFKGAGQELKLANCNRVLSQGLIPNQRAFNYTVNYLVANKDALKSPQCALTGTDSRDRLCDKCRDRNWVKAGFENQCSFLINDVERPWVEKGEKEPTTRTSGYYVDLCAKDPAKIVTSFYFNLGTGPKYDDTPNAADAETRDLNKSTLAGAFKIEPKVGDSFEPYNKAAYEEVKKRNNGKLYSLGLIGLNSSNNMTDIAKPIHVSPPSFKSSWGCPSVSEEVAKDFGRMVERGSTLYMAYAGERFEEKGGSCFNKNFKEDAKQSGQGNNLPGEGAQ